MTWAKAAIRIKIIQYANKSTYQISLNDFLGQITIAIDLCVSLFSLLSVLCQRKHTPE